jgi:UDPglucose 6-dehydrogenase
LYTLVIGLGKLGLPLAAVLADAGHEVYGFDKSVELIDCLSDGIYQSGEPELSELLFKNSQNLHYLHSLDGIAELIDIVFIIVPTPSGLDCRFSNEFVLQAVTNIGNLLRTEESKTVINIVSTVMPGSCDVAITQALEQASGQTIGKRIGLCYSPEFIALGSAIKDMQFPDMHLLGASHGWAGDILESVLRSIVKKEVPCTRMTLLEAELVKISVNNFIAMKISFANSLMQITDGLGNFDIDKVTEAIGLDSRIGSKYMKAAAPYGGPCFPRDTRAMSVLFQDFQIPWSLSSVTEKLNDNHIEYITKKVLAEAGTSKIIGILGISYKLGTPVIEESPGVAIAIALAGKGARVLTWDDENAEVPINSIESRNVESIINEADYFVITRRLKDLETVYKQIHQSKKPYFDLWRHPANT